MKSALLHWDFFTLQAKGRIGDMQGGISAVCDFQLSIW